MPKSCFASQERSLQQKALLPAVPRHNLIDRRLVAPNKLMTFFEHPPEKILVLTAGSELRTKHLRQLLENAPFEQDISRPRLLPAHHKPGLVPRSFVEFC